MKILYKICMLFFVLSSTSYANGLDTSKSKKIVKEYKTTKDVTVKVDNKYGSVSFELWNENKVDFSVDIKVGADSDKKSQELLDNIQVLFTEGNHTLQAVTHFKSSLNYNKEIHIKYTIKIPKNARVTVIQHYGDIVIPELYNLLDLSCKYGNVKIGKLHHKNNVLKMDYVSSAKIEDLNSATAEMRYSGLLLEKGNRLTSKGNYNTFKINAIEILDIDSNYSTFKINEIEKCKITGNYLKVDLESILHTAAIKSNYSTVKINANSKTESIEYTGNYANVTVNNLEQIPFAFDVTGQYTTLKTSLDLDFNLKSKTQNMVEYKGTYKKQPKLNLLTKGNYTTIYLKN